jgi:hypothetical protein
MFWRKLSILDSDRKKTMTKPKIKKVLQDGFDDALKDRIKDMLKNFVLDQENVRQDVFPSLGLKRIVEAYKMGLAAIEEMDD